MPAVGDWRPKQIRSGFIERSLMPCNPPIQRIRSPRAAIPFLKSNDGSFVHDIALVAISCLRKHSIEGYYTCKMSHDPSLINIDLLTNESHFVIYDQAAAELDILFKRSEVYIPLVCVSVLFLHVSRKTVW